ncbi:MAG: DUF1523 family protein [Nanoarchaeota archaeon]|nr:DUF1523 family protein [Nanoarchaeota archaeon]MCG2718711.1 DUF1523 family protein [Nanoarchaeota archaeon]
MKVTRNKIIGFGVAALICVGALRSLPHFDRETYTATVTEKQVKRYNGKDKYVIFTELMDGTTKVFENTDSLIEWKFDSSDIYGGLDEGKIYNIKTYGWRIPFLSAYENILDIEEIVLKTE